MSNHHLLSIQGAKDEQRPIICCQRILAFDQEQDAAPCRLVQTGPALGASGGFGKSSQGVSRFLSNDKSSEMLGEIEEGMARR